MATVTVRSVPGVVTINFPDTSINVGGGAVTTPGVSVSGSSLLAGDSLVYDGYVILTGTPASDGWGTINLNGAGYGNVEGATLGVLARLVGGQPSQLFINGVNHCFNPSSSGNPTNRVRIVLYPSANGSTTNMGYSVQMDQNIIGQFLPAATGTNLTFANNTITLTWGDAVQSLPDDAEFVERVHLPTTGAHQPGGERRQPPPSFTLLEKGWSPALSMVQEWRLDCQRHQPVLHHPHAVADEQRGPVRCGRQQSREPRHVVTSAVATITMRTPNNLEWWPASDPTGTLEHHHGQLDHQRRVDLHDLHQRRQRHN